MDTSLKQDGEATISSHVPVTPEQPGRRGTIWRTMFGSLAIIGIGYAAYSLAIYPRIQNSRELEVAAAAAGKKVVTVVRPEMTRATAPVILPANVQADRVTSIYSRVDGYLKQWFVDIGDHVQQGQVLAEIKAPQIDANLRVAQAQLELAEANLKLAQTNSVRSQQLFANKVNSQKELDTVTATEQVEAANRDNAAAHLRDAQDMKAYEEVRAPFSGVITARYIEVGSLVTSGSARTVQKLFDLQQSDPVRVFANVPQSDVTRVHPDVPATVTVDEYPGETFTGKVVRDAGAFDQSSRTILLEVDVPNPTGRLYSGMYAHVNLSLPNPSPTMYVPDNTIMIDSRGPHVATVDSADKIHFKEVTLGRDFGSKSEILGGLNAQDQIVQNPTDDLREGMTVQLSGGAT